MIKLSVVIICYNEEHNILRCLRSVKGIADEVILVDSFSKDRTVSTGILEGAIVFKHPFEGHIQQKNYALTKASYDHILSLDADEALDDLLKSEILRVKANFNQEGYYLKRLNNYCGYWVRHSGWYPDKKLRLFDRRKGSWKGTNPHDKFSLDAGDKFTELLNGDILHFSYYTVEEHFKQMEYFATIAANELFKKSKKPYWFHLVINPILHFVKSYIIKLGILDGWRGIQICVISSYGTYLKYKKLRSLNSRT